MRIALCVPGVEAARVDRQLHCRFGGKHEGALVDIKAPLAAHQAVEVAHVELDGGAPRVKVPDSGREIAHRRRGRTGCGAHRLLLLGRMHGHNPAPVASSPSTSAWPSPASRMAFERTVISE